MLLLYNYILLRGRVVLLQFTGFTRTNGEQQILTAEFRLPLRPIVYCRQLLYGRLAPSELGPSQFAAERPSLCATLVQVGLRCLSVSQ